MTRVFTLHNQNQVLIDLNVKTGKIFTQSLSADSDTNPENPRGDSTAVPHPQNFFIFQSFAGKNDHKRDRGAEFFYTGIDAPLLRNTVV